MSSAQCEKGKNHASGVGKRAKVPVTPRGPMLRESDHLDRQDREHAWHEIEDEAANQCT